jgi:hypothetical protein
LILIDSKNLSHFAQFLPVIFMLYYNKFKNNQKRSKQIDKRAGFVLVCIQCTAAPRPACLTSKKRGISAWPRSGSTI